MNRKISRLTPPPASSSQEIVLLFAADDASTIHATPPGATVEAADLEARTIAGVIAPYGVYGSTSAGPLKIRAGAIELPADLKRVKSNLDHNRADSTGYLVEAQDDAQSLRGRFKIGRTPLGDRALLEASEGIRDALSVELTNVHLDGDEVTAALLVAVGQVPIPAYSDARVESVAAAHTTERSTNMKCEHCGREHAEGSVQANACAAVVAASSQTQTSATQVTERTAPVTLDAALAAAPDLGSTQVQAASDGPSLDTVMAAMAAVHAGQATPDVIAALSDITQSANPYVAPDAYVGELWSGVQYTRRIVPLLSTSNLTSYKGTGWRWVVKPAVAPYGGDKAAVPSNAPTTEDEPWTAQRLAGAHDIDRKFYDFGDREFITSYFQAMTESYAMLSDKAAADFVVANAADVGDAPTLLEAAAVASDAVEDATNSPASFILVNRADRRGLLGISNNDVSAFLDMFGLTPSAFRTHPSVPLGQVIAGNKQAVEFKELPGSPIRAEALRISNGGVDGGVFGYYATLLHNAGGLARVDIGADQP